MSKDIMTNRELIGSIIQDLNNLVKEQQAGQHLQACAIIVSMTQKLANLMQTIDEDLKNRDETIEQLKDELRACGREVIDLPVEKFIEGEGNGK